MRNIIINSINTILAVAILFMGLPCLITGDLNHDKKVDLADAIIGVTDFAKTATEPDNFSATIKKAISTLSLVAGLNTQVKSENDANLFQTLDYKCLISEHTILSYSPGFFERFEKTRKHQSTAYLPPVPPPQPYIQYSPT